MSELFDEELMTTASAARHLNERMRDARYSPSVIWRWMMYGSAARNGQRIFLEYVKLGRRLLTSRQALSRFALRLAFAQGNGPKGGATTASQGHG